jgi:hypothetical protein
MTRATTSGGWPCRVVRGDLLIGEGLILRRHASVGRIDLRPDFIPYSCIDILLRLLDGVLIA